MRFILLLLVFLTISIVNARNILKVEYFIDTDPGFGNATAVTVNPGEDITINFAEDLDNIAPGFHQLYIRAKDDSGRWSIPFSKAFYIEKTFIEDPKITKITYAVDGGDTQEIGITSDPDVSENFVVDLSTLRPGFHVLTLWASDSKGSVCHILEKPFYIDKERIQPDISSIEYYFSQTDTITPVTVYDNFIPAGDIDLAIDLDIAGLELGKNYMLYIYGRDQDGIRGLAYGREFIVGSGNSVPEILDLPEHIEFNADSSYVLNLFDHVHDYETPDSLLTYKFQLSSDSIALMLNILNGQLTISAFPGYSGNDTLWITIIDDGAASDEAMILVTVYPSTGIEPDSKNLLPSHFSISQNYPNPFNPATCIRFALPEQEYVILEIFNIRGQKVTTLLEQKMAAGYHSIDFIPDNLPSGVFFYRIRAGMYSGIKKMIYLR